MVSPAKWICDALLVNQQNGYGQMGIYSAAIIFQTTLLFISSTISKPFLSMLSNMQEDLSDNLARMNIMTSWCLGIIVAVPLFCFPEIGQLIFGKEYVGIEFRQTMSLITFFTCVIMYKEGLARVLAAKSLMWWGLLSNAVWAIILVIAAFLLVPLGAIGLAASYALAYIGNTLLIMPLYIKKSLVPSATLFSIETGAIWLVLSALASISFFDLEIWIRAILFPIAFVALGFASFRIMRPITRRQ
jgi:O-antigen/teichoic acid export membrane protein